MTQTVTTLANGDKQIVITGTETWTIPSDWNDNANKFEAYGCGNNGATGLSTRSGGGGGGGSYQSVVNFPLKLYSLTENGVDGQKVAILSSVNTALQYTLFTVFQGVDENDPPNAVYGTGVTANGGGAGGGTSGGIGGSAPTPNIFVDGASGGTYTTVQFAGGAGGNGRANSGAGGGGGGGAAGPNGAGGAGGANSTTSTAIGRGGGGGNGGTAGSSTSATGGTAGTGAGAGGAGGAASTSGNAGGVGTTVFSGGGGGGAGDGTGTTSGGAGGLYGAGGGGGASSTISTGGSRSIGVLVITYTPLVSNTSNFFLIF